MFDWVRSGSAGGERPGLIIDMHCHWIPEALAEALRSREAPPRLIEERGKERLVVYRETLPFHSGYTEVDARLSIMDGLGVERHVLSCPGLFGIDSLPAREAVPLVSLFNDAAGALTSRHPDRFSALAALPFDDMDLATREFARSRNELGHAGAILPASAFVDLEHAERMTPLFELGNELGAHFFVHPGPRPDEVRGGADPAIAERDNAGQRHVSLDVQAVLSQVMVTLLYTGFLDPYPNISVQVANLGGSLPFLIERMDHVSALRTPDSPLPSSRAGGVYVDCSSFGSRSITMAIEVYGPQRLLFGTDHPIFDTARTIKAVEDAPIDAAAREALFHGNARALLGALS